MSHTCNLCIGHFGDGILAPSTPSAAQLWLTLVQSPEGLSAEREVVSASCLLDNLRGMKWLCEGVCVGACVCTCVCLFVSLCAHKCTGWWSSLAMLFCWDVPLAQALVCQNTGGTKECSFKKKKAINGSIGWPLSQAAANICILQLRELAITRPKCCGIMLLYSVKMRRSCC